VDKSNEPTSRGIFLRRVGMTLAAAVGVLAVPARARAVLGKCCLDNTRCSGTCPTGQYLHYCDCGDPASSYCVCHSGTTCYGPAPC
jgi:hypothetical protein